MDREIPKEVRQKERNKKIIRYSSIGVASIVVIGVLISVLRAGVEAKDLVFSTVDTGVIEVSVSASGKVVPAFEEIINSPINSRILEVYKKGGDSVDVGTPILKLDLQSTETEYKKLLDEEQMRRYKLDQLRVNNQTKLSDMAMQIKVSAMKLSRMKVELRNEHYLDSLGAGTTDKDINSKFAFSIAVENLTRIIEAKQEPVIVEILQHVEPKIKSIHVLKSGVSVDIGLNRLVPINMLGDGIRKLLAIITSLYGCKEGIIFIDEIDNGMHFSSLVSLWKAILKTARMLDVQVFATTHNIESLQALNKILSEIDDKEMQDEIMCYSLRHLPTDEMKAYEYPYEKFQYVINQEIEIR